jgi:hypothetical protein
MKRLTPTLRCTVCAYVRHSETSGGYSEVLTSVPLWRALLRFIREWIRAPRNG